MGLFSNSVSKLFASLRFDPQTVASIVPFGINLPTCVGLFQWNWRESAVRLNGPVCGVAGITKYRPLQGDLSVRLPSVVFASSKRVWASLSSRSQMSI